MIVLGPSRPVSPVGQAAAAGRASARPIAGLADQHAQHRCGERAAGFAAGSGPARPAPAAAARCWAGTWQPFLVTTTRQSPTLQRLALIVARLRPWWALPGVMLAVPAPATMLQRIGRVRSGAWGITC